MQMSPISLQVIMLNHYCRLKNIEHFMAEIAIQMHLSQIICINDLHQPSSLM